MALSSQALRRLLRLVILIVPLTAALIPNLVNAEVKTGIEALDALMETPEQLPDDTLAELLNSESDSKVLHALRALRARKLAASDNPEERLLALNKLKNDLLWQQSISDSTTGCQRY